MESLGEIQVDYVHHSPHINWAGYFITENDQVCQMWSMCLNGFNFLLHVFIVVQHCRGMVILVAEVIIASPWFLSWTV